MPALPLFAHKIEFGVFPALRAAQHGEDRVAVARVHVAVHGQRVLARGVEAAELVADRADESVGERRRREHEEDGREREQSQLPDPAPRTRRPWAMSAQQHGARGL